VPTWLDLLDAIALILCAGALLLAMWQVRRGPEPGRGPERGRSTRKFPPDYWND
jgi:hypothetical protein